MNTTVALLMSMMGVAIAAIWVKDLVAGEKVDTSAGLLAARDVDDSLFWPHWVAEYSTAIGLIVGAVGLLTEASWGPPVAALALGALFYTSTNSLGWAFAQRERFTYAIPMLVGVAVSILGAMHLLVG